MLPMRAERDCRILDLLSIHRTVLNQCVNCVALGFAEKKRCCLRPKRSFVQSRLGSCGFT